MSASFKRVLGDGLLPAAVTTLYASPTRARVTVGVISLVNSDSVSRVVNVFLNRSGTRRRIASKDLTIRAGFLIELDQPYVLEPGDVIEGGADVADAVEYTISGEEQR